MSATPMHCKVFVLVAALSTVCGAALTVGFYNRTCPSAERIVRQAVANAFANNPGLAAGLIRMHFHDCFVRGCDASVLIDSTANNTAEKDSPANNPSLRGFEVINAAKATLEVQCPNTVSCADIIAFAARDSASLAGNISYQVPSGRRDGRISNVTEANINLPPPTFNANQLVASFAAKNLTAEEMVILSGAHSIGVAHCATFTNRLYNFNGTGRPDPTLSSSYTELLQCKCPSNSNQTDPTVVALDIITPIVLDNKYYVGLINNLGLLTSDHALVTNTSLAAIVNESVNNPSGWAAKFAQAMVKMGNIEVLEGTRGDIRRNCSVVNSATSSSLINTLLGYDLASS
ncbi:peroxidase 5-like [Magnolia sinica]|uniref:peroxidase 5-like n=1 Tax=Magnolia sinica TaxID=86752 RepID=UPI0026591658|nr:peroxidase 5-like [Magnolia sinica]